MWKFIENIENKERNIKYEQRISLRKHNGWIIKDKIIQCLRNIKKSMQL